MIMSHERIVWKWQGEDDVQCDTNTGRKNLPEFRNRLDAVAAARQQLIVAVGLQKSPQHVQVQVTRSVLENYIRCLDSAFSNNGNDRIRMQELGSIADCSAVKELNKALIIIFDRIFAIQWLWPSSSLELCILILLYKRIGDNNTGVTVHNRSLIDDLLGR